jgi:hypothetical protein
MSAFAFEFAGGEVRELACDSVERAVEMVDQMYGPLVWAGQEDADGTNDDGDKCYRLLAWETEADAEGDSGVKSFGQLTWIG